MKSLKFLMFSSISLCVLMLSDLLQADISAPRPEIAVQNPIEVSSDREIKLNDIASVDFVEPQVESSVLNIKVLPAMSDGEVKKYKNQDLIKLIKEKIANTSEVSSLKWTYFASDEITITSKKNYFSALAIRNQIELYLKQKCQGCQIKLKELKTPVVREDIEVSSCQLQLDNLKAGGSFLVPSVCRAGPENKTYWISGVIQISKLAPVATRQLLPGDKISKDDFKMQIVDITFAKDSVPSEQEMKDQIIGKIISLNETIFKSYFKKELAITRGQVIRAVSGNEVFEVTSQAVAEEQGYVGDMIRIKNTESQKILSGQVVEKGVVRVQ